MEEKSGQQSLTKSVALVTGGGGGIGSAIARRLAESGAKLVITYNQNAQKAEAVMNSLAENDHLVVQASVTDSDALADLAQTIEQRYGRLDILVNNAGITRIVPHDDLNGLDDQLIDDIFRTNWRGALACVRAFRALLKAGDGGLIANISSIAARTAVGSNIAYCASKAALDSMTMSLARALSPEIRVVSVSPGWVDGEYAQRADPAYLQEQIDRTPLGRIARPEDVAEAVHALASGLTFTTGAIIPIDGGRPLN
ncbi:MAG: SDR family oxidoreductase [Pseudomonadota bacterium]